MSPSTCIIIPSNAKPITKALNPTSTPSHCSWSSSCNHCILLFLDVQAKECIEHASDKEEEIEDDRGSYGVSMHRTTITTVHVLITLWTLIFVSCSSCTSICAQKLQCLNPKIPQCLHQFISHT